jgi:hypothetical protein
LIRNPYPILVLNSGVGRLSLSRVDDLDVLMAAEDLDCILIDLRGRRREIAGCGEEFGEGYAVRIAVDDVSDLGDAG